jgi:hypothetical protein
MKAALYKGRPRNASFASGACEPWHGQFLGRWIW